MKKFLTILTLAGLGSCSSYGQTTNDPKERGACIKELKEWHSHPYREAERSKDVTRERCDKERRETERDFGNLGRVRFEPREPGND